MAQRDHLKGIKSSYDVIVIGSGLGGLTVANRLGGQGHSVLLLEHHYQLGGLASFFKRKNRRIFDISLHGFPYGMKKSCRKYWSKEIADDIVRVHGIRFENPQYKIKTEFDRTDFTRIMYEEFKVAPGSVDAFFEEVGAMEYHNQTDLTTGELFEKHFPGRNDVIRFLMEPITYANGSTPEDPAITYGIVFSNFMSKGCYIYRGGTDKLLRLMKKELLKNDVDIRIMADVQQVIVEDGQSKGVVVNGSSGTTNSAASSSARSTRSASTTRRPRSTWASPTGRRSPTSVTCCLRRPTRPTTTRRSWPSRRPRARSRSTTRRSVPT
jgi:phytoene dehydrogenase-like protein